MEDNNQTIEQTVSEQNDTIRFISDEEVAQAMSQPEPAEVAPEPQPEPEQPTQEAVAEPQVEEQQQEEIIDEPQPDQQQAQQEYAPEQIEGAVFEFLSERLGRNINSFDDLTTQQQEQRELDERIAAIAEFVENTGRDPRDWFVYQSMNPSEMDDLTAIQVQMASDYPNLSQDEISTLISSKYKLDPDLYSEDEVKLSQLQMKIDSTAARKGIEEMRLQYQAPERKEAEPEQTSLIDDNWVSGMRQELDAMEGIEFNLGNDKTFTFGMDNNYKNQLAEKNARLDEFFDPYVREDGSWDYDMLNMHRAVIDNVESIVQSVYRQGMSDGQRGIVQNAANATPTSPNQVNAQPASDPLAQQLRQILNISK